MKVYNFVLVPPIARRRWGLKNFMLVPAIARWRWGLKNFILVPPIARWRWGLKNFILVCLRLPGGDEVLKLYTLKLWTECMRSSKNVIWLIIWLQRLLLAILCSSDTCSWHRYLGDTLSWQCLVLATPTWISSLIFDFTWKGKTKANVS